MSHVFAWYWKFLPAIKLRNVVLWSEWKDNSQDVLIHSNCPKKLMTHTKKCNPLVHAHRVVIHWCFVLCFHFLGCVFLLCVPVSHRPKLACCLVAWLKNKILFSSIHYRLSWLAPLCMSITHRVLTRVTSHRKLAAWETGEGNGLQKVNNAY